MDIKGVVKRGEYTYRFTVSCGFDGSGKHTRKTMTYKVPAGTAQGKAEKMVMQALRYRPRTSIDSQGLPPQFSAIYADSCPSFCLSFSLWGLYPLNIRDYNPHNRYCQYFRGHPNDHIRQSLGNIEGQRYHNLSAARKMRH